MHTFMLHIVAYNEEYSTVHLALPLAILDLRVGRTVNHLSPFRSVVHIPDCIFKLQSSL